MLPAQHRLRSSADFSAVLRRRGRASAAAHLVILYANATPGRESDPARVGFVVSKAVGGSVVRNRTKRRLREQCRGRLDRLRPGTDYVVRALPAAATADSAALGSALDRALTGLGPRWSAPR